MPPRRKQPQEQEPVTALARQEPDDDAPKFTYQELVDMGFTRVDINAMMDAGRVSDAEIVVNNAPPAWVLPTTIDDVAVIMRRIGRIQAELAEQKKQSDRRSKRLKARLDFWDGYVKPKCLPIVVRELPETTDEKFVDHTLVRLQLVTYQGDVSMQDQRAFISYMEALERDLGELEDSIFRLTDLDYLTEKEADRLQSELRSRDRLLHRLTSLKPLFRLKIVTSEEMEGEEAWKHVGDNPIPDVGETYEMSLDVDAVLEFIRSYPEEVTGKDADGKPIVVPFTPPGIKRTDTRTELYGR